MLKDKRPKEDANRRIIENQNHRILRTITVEKF